jgi:hypothetical protein
MRTLPATTSAVERIRCAFRARRAHQKKGRPSLNKNPTHLHALAGSGAPRLYSRGPSGVFGGTRRAYSAEVASATKAGSMSPFAKASEDTRCAFLHGLTAVASCVGG